MVSPAYIRRALDCHTAEQIFREMASSSLQITTAPRDPKQIYFQHQLPLHERIQPMSKKGKERLRQSTPPPPEESSASEVEQGSNPSADTPETPIGTPTLPVPTAERKFQFQHLIPPEERAKPRKKGRNGKETVPHRRIASRRLRRRSRRKN